MLLIFRSNNEFFILFISLISTTLGDSAGGNLAAAVSLRLRDEKVRPALKIQVLLYPVIQSIDYQLPSHVDDRGPVLSDDIVGVFRPLIMDEYDQINKPIMTTVFNPLITRLWRINHV